MKIDFDFLRFIDNLTIRKSTVYILIHTLKSSFMIDFNDIEINKFQLNTLLNHQEKRGFKYLLNNELLCKTCNQYCNSGIRNYIIYLDRFNDIKVSGECNVCSSNVSMVMPFGENESFFRKAMQFRNTHAVLVES